MDGINVVELTIVIILFLLVTVLGFAASRWRRADDLMHLDEWGLGGRSFGSWITWFLLGGDLYTAYTFVAVPALMFGAGAAGFFAVPYTIIIYPLVFLVVARLWSVSHVRGFVTPADFVRSRFDSPTMALLVAITGIVATMPYIALQLVGIEAILKAMGVEGDLPLIVAFIILAHLHLQLGPAGAGADRRRQGHADLPDDHRRGHRHPVEARRLGRDLRGGGGEVLRRGRRDPARDRSAGVRDARAGLGAGAVPLPALDHRGAGGQQPRRAQAEHERAADLQPRAGPDRAARVHGHRGRGHADRHRRQHDRAGAVPGDVPELVRRHRVRRHRDRRPGAGRDHVDRRGQPVHPQHLQGVPEEGRHPAAGGAASPRSPRWWSSWARSWPSWASTRSSPSTCS